jgi:hypothetical protein
MPVPSTPQDHDAIVTVVLLVAGFFGFFPKVAVRLIVIILIAIVAYGLIVSLHSL